MMMLLARCLGLLAGAPKLLSAGALLAILTLAHQWWLERDARIKAQGVETCEAEHKLAAVEAERDAARAAVSRAIEHAERQTQIVESLRNERKAIKDEFEAHKLAASNDPRCLSDRVLNLLRGSGP